MCGKTRKVRGARDVGTRVGVEVVIGIGSLVYRMRGMFRVPRESREFDGSAGPRRSANVRGNARETARLQSRGGETPRGRMGPLTA